VSNNSAPSMRTTSSSTPGSPRWLQNLLHDNAPGLVAEVLQEPVVRRRDVGGSGRTERPAWQSPYGPPPHRAHRGRWAPVPGLPRSRSAVRRGYLCGRCGWSPKASARTVGAAACRGRPAGRREPPVAAY